MMIYKLYAEPLPLKLWILWESEIFETNFMILKLCHIFTAENDQDSCFQEKENAAVWTKIKSNRARGDILLSPCGIYLSKKVHSLCLFWEIQKYKKGKKEKN